MLNKLISLLKEFPNENNYLKIVKKDKELLEWVNNHWPNITNINEKIYLLFNAKPTCKFNNKVKFLDYKRGYGYCARAKTCKCLQEKCGTTSKPLLIENKVNRTKRIKDTKKKIYGDENFNNRPKSSNTLFNNYNVNNPMLSPIIKERLTSTVIEKYGVNNIMKDPCIKAKNRLSNVLNHGEFHTRAHLSTEIIEKLSNIEWLIEQNKTKTPLQISIDLGVSSTLIYIIFNKHNIDYIRHYRHSVWQTDVYEFIKSITTLSVIENDRSILGKKELDIVIPELKIAFECNGVLWHSELKGDKDKNYHKYKSELAAEQGYRLIHLFDNEWHTKQDIIKSRISGLLNANCTIHARKTTVSKLDTIQEKEFFNKTHQQGYTKSDKCFGLFYNNKLVAAMSFAKPRFNKKYEYELLRFSSELYTNVVGGASKLFTEFKKNYKPVSIISYSHKTFGKSTLYKNLGFTLSHSSGPSYYYTKNYSLLENRLKYQHHKLKNILQYFDASKTEWENMQNNGYDRIWDCGNDVWEWVDK